MTWLTYKQTKTSITTIMTKTKKTSIGDSLIHKQVVWKMSRLSRAMKGTSGLDEMMRSLLLS